MCTECLGNRNERPFTDLGPDAKWRPTEEMPFEHFRCRAREPVHDLIACHYFHRWFVVLDVMHVMDCKGVAGLVYGGVLSMLLCLGSLGANRPQRLETINVQLKRWQEAHPGGYAMPPLRMGNLVADGWADLHGPAIKAAMTKRAAPFFSHLADTFFVAGTDEEFHAKELARDLTKFYDALDSAIMFPTNEEVEQLRDCCNSFGLHYMWCRELARQSGQCRFPIRPKVHKMQHMPLWVEIINPRAVHNYAEESQIGTTTKVWKSCMSGKYKSNVQFNVLAKRLAGLFLRFEM